MVEKSDYYRRWFLSKFREMGVEPIPIEKPKIVIPKKEKHSA